MTFVSASALLLTSIHRPGCVEASTEQGSGPVQLYRELQLRLGRVRGAAGALHPAGGAGRGREQLIGEVACAWLNHLIELPDGAQQPWAHNFPVTVRNQLYIGEDKYIFWGINKYF